jgi:hypothetical protein
VNAMGNISATALLVSCCSALLVGACGSPQSSAPQPTVRQQSSPEPSPGNQTATALTVTFDYTDPQLWHYSGSFPYVDGKAFTLSKDISSSPPGMAKIAVALNIKPESLIFSVDNPGRPGGPGIEVEDHVAFPRPKQYLGPFPGGPGGGEHQNESPDNRPYGKDEIDFGVYEPKANSPTFGADGPEAAADQYISTVRNAPGIYVLNFVPLVNNQDIDDDCNVWLDPSSYKLIKAKDYTTEHCGRLTVSVHRTANP